MKRTAPAAIAIIGIVIALAGVVLGFSPIHREGAACGSAFAANTDSAEVADFTTALEGYGTGSAQSTCDAATSDRKTVAWAVLAPGIVLVLTGGIWLITIESRAYLEREQASSSSVGRSTDGGLEL